MSFRNTVSTYQHAHIFEKEVTFYSVQFCGTRMSRVRPAAFSSHFTDLTCLDF
jgi:hypothetical protein